MFIGTPCMFIGTPCMFIVQKCLLTCCCVTLSCAAISDRSEDDKYFFVSKVCSNSNICFPVNVVLIFFLSSSSLSLLSSFPSLSFLFRPESKKDYLKIFKTFNWRRQKSETVYFILYLRILFLNFVFCKVMKCLKDFNLEAEVNTKFACPGNSLS